MNVDLKCWHAEINQLNNTFINVLLLLLLIFISLLSYCLFPFCFSLYNQFLVVSKLLFVNMCVWQCYFCIMTYKLLPFDLSILILDKLCINLLCLYRYFLSY